MHYPARAVNQRRTISPAVRYDRGSPCIAITNESRDVSDSELSRIVAAIQKQVDRDFFPLWGWRAELIFKTRRAPRKAMRIVIKEQPDEDGALGYHFIDGLPMTYVFTRDADGNHFAEYAPVISHEVLEMIADPGVNLYAYGYYTKNRRKHRAWIPYEVCDPVQENLYTIDGVKVGDFVVPEWFEPERKPGSMKFSFLGSVSAPFAIAEGGYVDAVVGHRIRTLWGPSANRKKRRHRQKARIGRGSFLG